MAVTMGLSALSVITTVFVLHLHHQGAASPVPHWLRAVAFRYVSRILCLRVDESMSSKSRDRVWIDLEMDPVSVTGVKSSVRDAQRHVAWELVMKIVIFGHANAGQESIIYGTTFEAKNLTFKYGLYCSIIWLSETCRKV